ncbi:MAG: 6-bladed beta-propeller [Candidatus Saccharicenans sp.]
MKSEKRRWLLGGREAVTLKLLSIMMCLMAVANFISAQTSPVYKAREAGYNKFSNQVVLFRPVVMNYYGRQLFIADAGEGRVMIIDNDGKLSAVGRKGKGPGELDNISGLDVFGEEIYVADSFSQAVKKFNLKGEFLGEIKLPFSPVQVVVLGRDKVVVSRRPGFGANSEKIVYCYDAKGQKQWEAVDLNPQANRVLESLINEVILKRGEDGYFYLIWKYEKPAILKIDGSGRITETIRLDKAFPGVSLKLPLAGEARKVTMFVWNAACYQGKFYIIAPQLASDGDTSPSPSVMVINKNGQLMEIISLPQPARLLAIGPQLIYAADSEGILHVYQLEEK